MLKKIDKTDTFFCVRRLARVTFNIVCGFLQGARLEGGVVDWSITVSLYSYILSPHIHKHTHPDKHIHFRSVGCKVLAFYRHVEITAIS